MQSLNTTSPPTQLIVLCGARRCADCSHVTNSSYSRRDELAGAKIFSLCSLCPAGAELYSKRGSELWTGSVCTCQHNRQQVVTTRSGTR